MTALLLSKVFKEQTVLQLKGGSNWQKAEKYADGDQNFTLVENYQEGKME
jgi:hypothetical protein